MQPYWTDGQATIWHANALDLPLPDSSVDLVVTSPPYFGLRSYQDAGEHYTGQLGSEPTPAEFVDALIAATREMVRVLKPSGSLWINLGDKYSGGGRPGSETMNSPRGGGAKRSHIGSGFVPDKSLMGIPWRYALRCIDDLGLILRAEVIWSKPNGLPESVTDRVRRSHEQWFHMVKEPRYYSAVDEVREEYSQSDIALSLRKWRANATEPARKSPGNRSAALGVGDTTNPLGKLPGSVWTIPDDGPSLVRSILGAVAAGALTPEEGERLWLTSRDSWGTYESPTLGAGNGRATATLAGTPRSQSAGARSSSSTESRTNSTSDRSPTDSPSTTSVGTPHASDQTTSSPSPSARTSAEPTPNGSSADTGTTWPTPTQSGHQQGSHTRSAGRASSPASDAGESVWVVPTQPLRVPPDLGIDHFAAFPFEFPRRIIRGWSPRDVCTACGEGRRPTRDGEWTWGGASGPSAVRARAAAEAAGLTPEDAYRLRGSGSQIRSGSDPGEVNTISEAKRVSALAELIGYGNSVHLNIVKAAGGESCACLEPTADTTPGVVLDPFGGTGTTALLAAAEGRTAHHVDLSADYCRLAQWRITDPGERARAREVEKPAVEMDGQDDLLRLLADG